MTFAIFGISNDGLNLVVNLLILMLVVVWLALIVFTFLDARRRVSDPFLVACATVASFIPYIGTAVYAILRPPEFLEDAHERELEIKAAELRVRQLEESSCPQCEFPIERSYLRCPKCQRRLKNPCGELRQAGRPPLVALPLLRDRHPLPRALHDQTRLERHRLQTPGCPTAEKSPRKSPRRGRARGRRQPGAAAQTTIPKEPRT